MGSQAGALHPFSQRPGLEAGVVPRLRPGGLRKGAGRGSGGESWGDLLGFVAAVLSRRHKLLAGNRGRSLMQLLQCDCYGRSPCFLLVLAVSAHLSLAGRGRAESEMGPRCSATKSGEAGAHPALSSRGDASRC